MGLIGKITGSDAAARAGNVAAGQQKEAGEKAIREQYFSRDRALEGLDPYEQAGQAQLGQLPLGQQATPLNLLFHSQQGLEGTPDSLSPYAGRLGAEQSRLAAAGGRDDLALAQQQGQVGQGYTQGLRGNVSQGQELDPNVLNSPFFQALQEEGTRNLEKSAASRGRLESGDTADAIARQSMLLGQDFAQQDLNNRMASQGQRFGQLQSALGFGLGAQQQTFQNITGARQQGFQNLGGARQQNLSNLQGIQQQDFANQTGLAAQRFNQGNLAQQTDFANRMASQGQDFNQRLNLLNVGQNAATNQANIWQGTGNQVSNNLTGIGNAQAAGTVAGANAQTAAFGGLMGLAGTVGGAALGGPMGAAIGGSLFSPSPAQNPGPAYNLSAHGGNYGYLNN